LVFEYSVTSNRNRNLYAEFPLIYEVFSMITIRRFLVPALGVAVGAIFLAMAAKAQRPDGGPINAAQELAPTLAYPATPIKAPDEEGFIRRWLVLEPISANGLTQSVVQATVKKEYFAGQFTALPHDGNKANVEGTDLRWHAIDTRLYNVNLYHFAYALGKPTSNVLFWAVTVLDCPNELNDVRLAIGSNAASVWWVNGKEVIGIYGDRQTVIDDGVSKRLTLKKGSNFVRCAVVNGGGATDFCARFLNKDDAPVKEFTVNLDGAAE
jgi:hypothetical protein